MLVLKQVHSSGLESLLRSSSRALNILKGMEGLLVQGLIPYASPEANIKNDWQRIPKMSEDSQVRAFYKGKNFFITGGTGFVGLCLIEKILRCIPESGTLYLLMRPKKGKDISSRLEEFPKNP
ncbi:Fatty-acyl-CoA reductase, partial [Operophtera brumata]